MCAHLWPVDGYLAHLAAGGARPGTVALRRYQLQRAARAVGRPVEAVTVDDLVQLLARPSWSAATRRSMRSALREYFGWAARRGVVASSPAAELPRMRARIGAPRPAGEDVVRAVIGSLDPRTRLMARLAAIVGLRCCEIALVHSRDMTREQDGWTLTVHGKGGHTRVVPLDEGTAVQLRARGEGWAFPGRIDGHLSAAYVSRLLSRALPAGVTGHMLRHRAGTVAYAHGGRDLLAVRDLLGHASVSTTQVYTATPRDAVRAAMAAAAA